MKKENVLELLMILWIISSIFDTVIFLPVFNYKLQPFEVFFCFFLLLNIPKIRSILNTPFQLKWPLLTYGCLAIINTLIHFESNVILENMGTLYTSMIPVVFCFSLIQLKHPIKVIKKGFMISSILFPLCCLFGYLLYQFGVTSNLVKVYPDFPYLGTIVRFTGFAHSPNQAVLFSSVLLFFILFIQPKMNRLLKIAIIITLTLTAVFTISKEIILIPTVLFLTYVLNKRTKKVLQGIYLVMSVVVIISFTFFYFSKNGNTPTRTDMIHDEVVLRKGTLSVYPTSYYYLFISSVQMIKENPITGIGFGNYPKEIQNHMDKDSYPNDLYTYEAHDNYVGIIAQYGIGYFLILIWMIYRLYQLSTKASGQEASFVSSCLVFIFLFGFIYFSYHTRMMWMLLGLFQYFALKNSVPLLTQKVNTLP